MDCLRGHDDFQPLQRETCQLARHDLNSKYHGLQLTCQPKQYKTEQQKEQQTPVMLSFTKDSMLSADGMLVVGNAAGR